MTAIRRTVCLSIVSIATGVVIVWAQGLGSSSTDLSVMPEAVQNRARAPRPVDAIDAQSIGKGTLTVSTANSPTDGDSFWTEKIDIDGDGQVDDASLIWDDEDKVLYAYAERTFACRDGAVSTGGLIVAVYGSRSPRHQPTGSGFWLASLDNAECTAQARTLRGCKFVSQGTATACGTATLDDTTHTIVFAAETR